MKIIFIASLSHSGSTLLDLMLNAHPNVVSVGELKQLSRFARFGKPGKRKHKCTCGAESLWTCRFWSRVSALTLQKNGKSIGDLNVEDYQDLVSFQRDNVVLFEAIAAAAGKNYIVDSSKQRSRLNLLLETPGLDVFPVFLLRDPKGQICSVAKKTSFDMRQSIANYVATNQGIYSVIKDRPHMVMSYEHLVLRPKRELGALMEAIGLSFDPVQLSWASQERHNVGGNGMRRRKTSELKLDDRWRYHLTFSQKLIINLGTLAGRYPFVRVPWPAKKAVWSPSDH